MAKIVVIDWGHQELRLLTADLRGTQVVVEELRTIELPEGEEAEECAAVREELGRVLRNLDRSGTKVLGLVGRTQAVLRDIRLPDAPAEEIPSMVRFQAIRELSFSVERAAIDYDLIGGPDAAGGRQVILAALQQEVIERWGRLLEPWNLEPGRLGLRPYATWQAYRKSARRSDEAVLVVNLTGELLELTVGRGSTVLFSRATLFPTSSDGTGTVSALAGEVRRTLAAFANQMPGVEIRQTAFAAGPSEHQELSASLETSISLPVNRFDPLQGVALGERLKTAPPDQCGAYAAVVGAALSAGEVWPVDFANPKKPVPRRDRRKPLAVLAAGIVALVVGSGYLLTHQKLAVNRAEIARLQDQQKQLDRMLQEARVILEQYQAVQEWTNSSVNALEELKRLTEQVPDTRDMYATGITITGAGGSRGGGGITFEGVAREHAAISKLQGNLDGQPIGAVQPNPANSAYPLRFKSNIAISSSGIPANERADSEGSPKQSAPTQSGEDQQDN